MLGGKLKEDEMKEMNYKNGGLCMNKYRIEKLGDTKYEPVSGEAEYFVLRIDKDPHAKVALKAYMESVREDNPKFAQDIQGRWFDERNTEGSDNIKADDIDWNKISLKGQEVIEKFKDKI